MSSELNAVSLMKPTEMSTYKHLNSFSSNSFSSVTLGFSAWKTTTKKPQAHFNA